MLDELIAKTKKDRMKEGTPLMHFLKPLAEKKQRERADRTVRVLQQYSALTQLLQQGGRRGGMQGGMMSGGT
jgi:hypothetical protein